MRGAFFADVLDPARQTISGSGGINLPHEDFSSFLAGDWGLTSTAVCFACARAKREHGRYPRGSLILLDETSSAAPDDTTFGTGLGWTPSRFGDHIVEMAKRTGCRREGVLDDARGLVESVIEIMAKPPVSISFQKPMKMRREGWSALRELMFNSKVGNGKPGLFVSDRCRGFWATMPDIPRDELRPDDVNTGSVDHFADSARYAACYSPPEFSITRAYT